MHIVVAMISADQIKQARKKLGESQAAFGGRFGVDQSTIHRWETDSPPQTGPAAKLLDRFFGNGAAE